MAAHIPMSLPRSNPNKDETESTVNPGYWNADFHSAKDGNVYLRAEEWLQDLHEFILPARHETVQVTLAMGEAIMRYREELKMYAAIEDQKGNHPIPRMEDLGFLTARHEAVKQEWPLGKDRAVWWRALEELRALLDERIKAMPHGAFVKFSVRSPKDAAPYMPSYVGLIHDAVAKNNIHPDHPEALAADVSAIKYANWMALKCDSGEDAILLFVRSDRIYLDILQHDLFAKGNKQTSFDLKIHIFEFFTGFHPDWEFRAFVANGQRTAITLYNPWVYSQDMMQQKDAILKLILELWDRAQPNIRSENYSLDFAVAPDLSGCWIVELNNFLPPLAGSGLFDYYLPSDRDILMRGPFEFRIRTTPVTEDDFVRVTTDEEGNKKTIHMQPATPHMMLYVKNYRRKLFGLPPLLDSSPNPTPSSTSSSPIHPVEEDSSQFSFLSFFKTLFE